LRSRRKADPIRSEEEECGLARRDLLAPAAVGASPGEADPRGGGGAIRIPMVMRPAVNRRARVTDLNLRDVNLSILESMALGMTYLLDSRSSRSTLMGL